MVDSEGQIEHHLLCFQCQVFMQYVKRKFVNETVQIILTLFNTVAITAYFLMFTNFVLGEIGFVLLALHLIIELCAWMGFSSGNFICMIPNIALKIVLSTTLIFYTLFQLDDPNGPTNPQLASFTGALALTCLAELYITISNWMAAASGVREKEAEPPVYGIVIAEMDRRDRISMVLPSYELAMKNTGLV